MKPANLSPEVCEQLQMVQAKPGADLSRFPDFLILGPQRTGTSWLSYHLKAHPEVFLPKGKETYFFSTLLEPERQHFDYPRLEDYLDMAMSDSTPRKLRRQVESLVLHQSSYAPKVLGDATASNATLSPAVIREICLINPDIKAILTMRVPKERVWSHAKKKFTEHSDQRIEDIDPEALDKFLRAGGQLQRGMYSVMIENWRKHLKPDNLLIAEFRLIDEEPKQFLTEVLTFLGVEATRFPEQRELKERVYPTEKSSMPDTIKERIAELYSTASQDYESTLQYLNEHQVSPGIYRL
ncbi:MAG: sulfotransferase domain-containing protein [Verrucomicrobiota bacterium]